MEMPLESLLMHLTHIYIIYSPDSVCSNKKRSTYSRTAFVEKLYLQITAFWSSKLCSDQSKDLKIVETLLHMNVT